MVLCAFFDLVGCGLGFLLFRSSASSASKNKKEQGTRSGVMLTRYATCFLLNGDAID